MDILSSLKTQSPAILIIGGGITGAGLFHDLALQGVDVLLIDRGDFCSGSSAASSHIVSSGFRYLENGKLRLMNEAVRERNRMIENAPHLVRPLPTVITIFKPFSGLLTRIVLMLYDTFTRWQGTVPLTQFEEREEWRGKYPKLHDDIQYIATCYDGQTFSPERYIVELILDGEADGPHARALNYVSFKGAQGNQVTLMDELSGETFGISPKFIVNAAGPWIDRVNSTLGLSTRYIGGTKGSHLVLDHPELREAIGKNGFFFENEDGHTVLILPFYDRVIIGTTTLPITDPDSARCTPEEEKYFFELVSGIFPTIKVTPAHIVFRFSGVRPLETMKASIKEDRTGNIPVFSLVGGKWTSYRAFSEQVADRLLGLSGSMRKVDTRKTQIGGGKNYPLVGLGQIEYIKKVADESGLGKLQPKKLFQRYGTRAMQIAKYIKAAQDEALKSRPDWTRREVEFLVEREKAVRVDDILLRRSTLAWLGQVDKPLVEELAEVMGDFLGWTAGQKKAEAQRTLDLLKDLHGVSL